MGRMIDGSGASWVWPAESMTGVNQYVEFKQEFDLAAIPNQAKLLISVDSNYTVRINGQFIDCGQYHDYPNRKVYDILPLENVLRKGENVLHVVAYYQGESSMQYLKGQPGLVYILKTDRQQIVSGAETAYRVSQCYLQGLYAKITDQLSFSFEYDARNEDCEPVWITAKQKDLTPLSHRPLAQSRPITKVAIKDRLVGKIIGQGVFKRFDSENKTVAQLMQTDFLSTREKGKVFGKSRCDGELTIKPLADDEGDGVYLLIDLGREQAGFFDLELAASDGTVVDIGYGEHIEDLRVHTAIGRRNFAARYICKSGKQTFTHWFKRFGGRYIQLHISNIQKGLTLYYAGLRPAEYPVERQGAFESPDSLQNKIYDVSVRTLHLCMHEHYEDTPWREQALYANDSRNQALCGYYCFGDYQFPAASFDLLGQGMKDDGYLEICAPAEHKITIPSFSLAWILELGDYWRFTGDRSVIEPMMPRVKTMVGKLLTTMTDNLLPSPQGPRYWHFYDWADGLDGSDSAGFATLKTLRFDAPLNLFFVQALQAAAELAKACGHADEARQYRATADNMKPAIHDAFWNDQTKAYVTYRGESQQEEHLAELVQALAISAKICPEEIEGQLRQRLAKSNNGWVETTLSQSIYKFEALLEDKETFGNWVFEKITRDWGGMLFNGATSFWETLKGAADFDNAGSLCHGWSAVPVYFYQAYILGIKPLEPGFKTFSIDPAKTIVDKATGIVPTPYGPIKLTWKREKQGIVYRVSHPETIQPVIPNLAENDTLRIE